MFSRKWGSDANFGASCAADHLISMEDVPPGALVQTGGSAARREIPGLLLRPPWL